MKSAFEFLILVNEEYRQYKINCSAKNIIPKDEILWKLDYAKEAIKDNRFSKSEFGDFVFEILR